MRRTLCLALLACITTLANAGDPWQREREIELLAVGCAPNPVDHRIASRAEFDRLLEAWNRDCPREVDRERKARFVRAIEKAGIDFEREALMVLSGWYGTGMARASLDLRAEGSVVTAAVTWRVPTGPVTPDTATYRFAFRVDKTRVTQVRVTVDGREKAVHALTP